VSSRFTPRASRAAGLALASVAVLGLPACDAARSSAPPPDARAPGAALPPSPQGALPDAPFADLSSDTLTAPPSLDLQVEPVPGALRLRWETPPPDTTSLRLFEHDAATDVEVEIDLAPVPTTGPRPPSSGVTLFRATHRHPWTERSWRLERCDADDCLASRRTRPDGGVLDTVHTLTPPVAVVGERFGTSVASNANGTVQAIAAPVEGRLSVILSGGDTPAFGTPLARLHDMPSTSRALAVAASASGDTLAVLSGDVATGADAEAIVFERLGENWIETARFGAFASPTSIGDGEARPHIALAADGSRLLVACTGAPDCPVALHASDATGWHPAVALPPIDDGSTVMAVTASRSLARVATLRAVDGAAPALRVYEAARDWRSPAPLALPFLAADAPLVAALDERGSGLVVGGLEASRSPSPAAVLWRYRLGVDDAGIALQLEDSVRLFAPAGRAASLTLAADGALDTVAFARHAADGGSALTTFVTTAGRWRPALTLPADAATLARQTFGQALAVDAAGDTLTVGSPRLPDLTAAPGTVQAAGRVWMMRATISP